MRSGLASNLRTRAVLGWLFLVPASFAVQAQADDAFGPDTIDVSGVKLGMPATDAIAALHAFDAAFTIKKMYLEGTPGGFGGEGTELPQGAGQTEAAILWDIVATRGNLDINDSDKISVWLSPVPGQERVIAVLREKDFNQNNRPPIEQLLSGIFAKYPKDKATFSYQELKESPVVSADWLFDNKKRLLSKTTAVGARREGTAGRLPRSVMAGQGTGLGVYVDGYAKLANILYISLYDSDALYKSIGQGKAAYAAEKERVDAEVAKKAGESAPKTKF